MKKNRLIFVLIVFALLSLSACSAQTTSEDDDGATDLEKMFAEAAKEPMEELSWDDFFLYNDYCLPGTGNVSYGGPSIVIANYPNQNLFIEVINLTRTDDTFTLTVAADSLVEEFRAAVDVVGSVTELGYTIVPVPVIDNPQEGEYTITCTLSHESKEEDLVQTFTAEVYAPSEKELTELLEYTASGEWTAEDALSEEALRQSEAIARDILANK
jgi:hypothetical protein